MSSPSSLHLFREHVAAGARFGERGVEPVVAAYGDTAVEYSAARSGAGLVDLPARGILEVAGPPRQKFLQGMLSNDVLGRGPGQGCRAALLTAKGAVRALVRVLVERDAVALEVDSDRIQTLQATLEHYRVAAPVRFTVRPVAVLALLGPRAPDVLRAAGAPSPPAEPEGHAMVEISGHPVRLVRAGDLPLGGFGLHVPPEGAPSVWQALRAAGARPMGFDALDALRVEAMRPWYGSDVTEENLLHETGLVGECHSPAKGCYVGQEIVARLSARGGHVNKALRGLRLTAPTASGAPLAAGGKNVGRVTTAAESPRLGPIALAYVHRDHFGAGCGVEVDGAPATVVTSFEEEAEPPSRE
jgi:folate-binding protein YgfZ